jgi:glycosyltransferase involved in cell wall biosynthesis
MISVCIATYNGSSYIEEQLNSILRQLADDDEVVISDDGSDDGTAQIIDAIADKRIRWAGRGGRMGVVKNFERALADARGELVFLSDQDDVWLPGKVAKCCEALQDNILVVTDCRVVDKQLKELVPSFFCLRNSGQGFLRNLYRNGFLGCCMAFRRELLEYALPIPAKAPMHDMWLGLIAEIRGEVFFLPEPLSLYRRHGQNASPTAEKSRFSLFQQLKFRVVLAWLIFNRVLSHCFASKSAFWLCLLNKF